LAVGNAVEITTRALPGATVGLAYSATLAVNGGVAPYVWTAAAGSLPTGLSLSATGELTGTPTTAGVFSFNVQVEDGAALKAQRSYSVSVEASPAQSLRVVTGALPLGIANVEYNRVVLTASGGTPPYQWSLVSGRTPDGLSVCGQGCISGTPTAVGSVSFGIEVRDSSSPVQTARQQFVLTVANPPGQAINITTLTLPNARVGVPYDVALSAAGGVAPYSFRRSSGAGIDGVSLDNTGVFSGAPTQPGVYGFTLQVTDSTGGTPLTMQRSYTVSVWP
jgi:hypothetical protein